ncbi:MAG: preprotein translocase subunit SecG [Cellvibrionaceae bacterium]|nr:preprotein translocase subunit SecG [Cellvibrionaceae bacterium]MCV6627669.1 preprotein translocase subunit SecG [Cellvibrionaceae bacterium]
MEKIILIVHMLTALGIIGLILLQQGKGAEAGASFGGGASQTVFGSSGSGNFFSRTTAILATVFFVTSFGLAVVAKQNASVDQDEAAMPTLVTQPGSDVPSEAPAGEDANVSDLPTLDEVAEDAAGELPALEAEVAEQIEAAAEQVEAGAETLQNEAAAAADKASEEKPQ